MAITELEMLARLLIAVLAGGAIGLERERKNQPAGLRTHIAVILGATLIMIISKYGFVDVEVINKDPARLAAQVVSGIGFLGAGTIIVHRNMIRGLTTAASLWTTAGIGLAIGAGMYIVGIGAAVMLLVTLVLIQHLEIKAITKKYKRITVQTTNLERFMQDLETVLKSNDIRLHEVKTHKVGPDPQEGIFEELEEVEVFLHLPVYANSSFLLMEFSKIEGVQRVEA